MALFSSLFTGGGSFLVGFLKNEILGFDENFAVVLLSDLQQCVRLQLPRSVCVRTAPGNVKMVTYGNINTRLSPVGIGSSQGATCLQWRIVVSRGPGARNSVGPFAMVRPNVCQLEALEAPPVGSEAEPRRQTHVGNNIGPIENWLKIRYLGRCLHP